MILSEKYKFLFIKGKKIAGTSLEVLLSGVCGSKDIITPITPIDEMNRLLTGSRTAQNYGEDSKENRQYMSMLKYGPSELLCNDHIPNGTYYNHMSLCEVLDLYGDIPTDWTIFAFERCPYRKIISFANMQLNFTNYQRTGMKMTSTMADLKYHLNKVIDDRSILNVKNIDLYKDRAGRVRTEIFHFENLKEDVKTLMSRLSINTYPRLEHFKEGMQSNNIDLLDIFSQKQINTINELFSDEFECFGYQMIE